LDVVVEELVDVVVEVFGSGTTGAGSSVNMKGASIFSVAAASVSAANNAGPV
jgi:hypothetical protein